ncbi:unnamed protein product [Taenia asiatica]|uniref:Uncharacterized protein n=1 Tax=Taenia asiatica TaxID=60517 RepID=A0A0R3WAP0_TAEAS|nr:unnamed protein product [Taenia asiatica]
MNNTKLWQMSRSVKILFNCSLFVLIRREMRLPMCFYEVKIKFCQVLHGSSRHPLSEYGRFYNLSYASIAEQPSRRLTDMYRRNALHTPATSNSISHLHHFHIPQAIFYECLLQHLTYPVREFMGLMAPPPGERRLVLKRANFLRGFEVHSDRFMLEGGDLSEAYPSRDFIKRY